MFSCSVSTSLLMGTRGRSHGSRGLISFTLSQLVTSLRTAFCLYPELLRQMVQISLKAVLISVRSPCGCLQQKVMTSVPSLNTKSTPAVTRRTEKRVTEQPPSSASAGQRLEMKRSSGRPDSSWPSPLGPGAQSSQCCCFYPDSSSFKGAAVIHSAGLWITICLTGLNTSGHR